MGEEGTFYKAVFILGVTFTAGVIAGYKVGYCPTFTGNDMCVFRRKNSDLNI